MNNFITEHEVLIECVVTIIVFVGVGLYWYLFKPHFFTKIKQGFSSNKTALVFINEHRKIWFFIALRISSFLFLFLFLGVLQRFELISIGKKHVTMPVVWTTIGFLIIGGILVSLLVQFINLAATHYVIAALKNKKMTIVQAFKKTGASARTACKFALADYAVTFLTRNGKSKNSRFGLVNNLLKLTVGVTWDLGTFFIMPVIAEEHLSLRQSITRSAEIMKTHFGRFLGFQVGSRIFVLPAFAFFMSGILLLIISSYFELYWSVIKYIFLCMFILALIFFIIAIMVIEAVRLIFVCAAYNYSQGKPTGPLDKHFIEQRFEK